MNIRTLSITAGFALLASGLVPATAAPDVDEIIEAAAASQGQLGAADIVPLDAASIGGYEASTESSRIAISGEAKDGIDIRPLQGNDAAAGAFAIGLPSEIGDSGAPSLTDDGAAHYDGSDDASAVVQATEGGMRLSTIIDSAEASSVYTYQLPAGVTGSILEDGSVSLERESVIIDPESGAEVVTRTWVGMVGAPWAADANGKAIETSYQLSGDSLVQVVEHRSAGVAYPVVADPAFWWGWNIYLSKAVVQQLADVVAAGGNAATVAGLLLARVPGVGTVAGGTIALAGALISFGAAMLRVCDLGRGVYVGQTWITGVLPFTPSVLRHGYFCVPN